MKKNKRVKASKKKVAHKRKSGTKKVTLLLLIILIGLILLLAADIAKSRLAPSRSMEKDTLFVESPTPTETLTPTKTPIPTKIIKRAISTVKPSANPSIIETLTPTVNPTPTTRASNPPIMTISYPQENQSVEFTDSSQQFCVADIPAGGDRSNLQRKHNINDTGWTSYVDIFTLCFEPNEGFNRFHLQYKNGHGDESVVYTRQFTFHRTNQ